MLSSRIARASSRPVISTSFLAFVILAGCAKASDPEMFQADPLLLNDFTASLPSHGRTGSLEYEIIQGLAIFEGDILLGSVDEQGIVKGNLRGRGLGRSDTFGRWPDGIVPYLAPTNSTPQLQKKIQQAMDHWMEETSITFVERTKENRGDYPNFLRFDKSNGCASYVGMRGGEQPIMVSDACSMGSIVHELGHALGLFHEHTRPDRDNYARVDWDQIVPGKEINYNILTAGVENLGPYDYGSIMHYGEYYFSATGEKTIIVPDGVIIGQREALSEIDAASINQMYATDLALFQPITNEVEGGYEIGINVSNQGNLGAQQVLLTLELANDSEWKGMSDNSGWDCTTQSAELRCTRSSMPEFTESGFSLLVDPKSGSIDDLSVLLSARTMDTDTSNNAFNHDGVLDEAGDNTEDEPSKLAANTTVTANNFAVPGAAAPRSNAPVSNDASGGGADNGLLATASLALLLWRRRARKQRVERECG